jgi:Trm5-related predicted tRNA methylase
MTTDSRKPSNRSKIIRITIKAWNERKQKIRARPPAVPVAITARKKLTATAAKQATKVNAQFLVKTESVRQYGLFDEIVCLTFPTTPEGRLE